ncbi:transposase [Sphingomonas sp. UYP23]
MGHRRQTHLARTITPLHLPSYSPELNLIERVWLYLRERFLSHRLFATVDAIVDACCDAWNALLPKRDASKLRLLRLSMTGQSFVERVLCRFCRSSVMIVSHMFGAFVTLAIGMACRALCAPATK